MSLANDNPSILAQAADLAETARQNREACFSLIAWLDEAMARDERRYRELSEGLNEIGKEIERIRT